MAKINALPSLEIINTLKGTLDFYYWKGIPCVRKWPVIPMSSRTQASLDSARLFGLIVQGWALVGGAAKALYIEAAKDQPRTGRDLYVSGVLGGQHEASMSDFLDLLIECKDYLAALQALLGPLGSINTDDLQVDIKSALATLPVKGEDQLFSVLSNYWEHQETLDTVAGDNFLRTADAPPGQYRLVTNIAATNTVSVCSIINIRAYHNAVRHRLKSDVPTLATQAVSWQGLILLDDDDYIQAEFKDCVLNDNIYLDVTGYQMTIET